MGWFSSDQTGLVFFIKSQRAFCVLFCEWKEGTIIANDSHLRGDTMNDIYAYDPDTEEEAGQCVDEVIQIAEESGAEIQFYSKIIISDHEAELLRR